MNRNIQFILIVTCCNLLVMAMTIFIFLFGLNFTRLIEIHGLDMMLPLPFICGI